MNVRRVSVEIDTRERTLEGEEADEGGAGRVVHSPAFEETGGQVEALPSCQDGLLRT